MTLGYGADDWMVCEAQLGDTALVIRMRAVLPHPEQRHRFGVLVILSWPHVPTDGGMPDAATFARMSQFEDALVSGTEARDVAVPALSLTGGGRREWRYYAQSAEDFMESVDEDLGSRDVYPVTISSYLDPEWLGLREFHEVMAATFDAASSGGGALDQRH